MTLYIKLKTISKVTTYNKDWLNMHCILIQFEILIFIVLSNFVPSIKTTVKHKYLSMLLTKRRSFVFSLRAPTQPVKPMINMTPPIMMNTMAGSRATFVRRPIFVNVSFSVQAHKPMPHTAMPISWNTKKYVY